MDTRIKSNKHKSFNCGGFLSFGILMLFEVIAYLAGNELQSTASAVKRPSIEIHQHLNVQNIFQIFLLFLLAE